MAQLIKFFSFKIKNTEIYFSMKLTSLIILFFSFSSFAQKMTDSDIEQNSPIELNTNYNAPAPKHQIELGLHAGLLATYGDVKVQPTWAAGIHIRRAIDYVFSIRLDGRIGQSKGEDRTNGAYLTDFQSGAAQLVVSINNLKWDGETVRKFNPYMFAGGGLTRFRVDALPRANSLIAEQDWSIMMQIESGIGIAYRINERLNIGIETNIVVPIGEKSDLIDGVDRQVRDVINYTNIRLNFNIGNGDKILEPLYWVNPMDAVMRDIQVLKDRPQFDPTDKDKDGVLDMVDEELDTPLNAPVDTKGRTLDSDGDGLADYLDKEPYSIPGYSVDEFGRNNDPKLKFTTEEDVQNMLEEALKMQTDAPDEGFDSKTELINWILPMVHFDIDNYQIRYADYGNLANVAKVVIANPELKFVVLGYTDKTASDFYNAVLSYNRSKAVIEFLVGAHGIPREQLILQYSGEDEKLVPSTTGDSFMNRRVEFRVARVGEVDMAHPKK
jgi:outer membrane protein OmpA-like peptidoglycan-associated protein